MCNNYRNATDSCSFFVSCQDSIPIANEINFTHSNLMNAYGAKAQCNGYSIYLRSQFINVSSLNGLLLTNSPGCIIINYANVLCCNLNYIFDFPSSESASRQITLCHFQNNIFKSFFGDCDYNQMVLFKCQFDFDQSILPQNLQIINCEFTTDISTITFKDFLKNIDICNVVPESQPDVSKGLNTFEWTIIVSIIVLVIITACVVVVIALQIKNNNTKMQTDLFYTDEYFAQLIKHDSSSADI